MDVILEILQALNTISPLGIAGLLGVVIFMLVKGQKDSQDKYETVTGNHLHELPTIAENIGRCAESLQRIEVKLADDLSYIKAKVNGK